MRKCAVSALAGVLMLTGLTGVAAAQSGDGIVTVVHGVPDLTVDVYVNGDLTLEDFAPGTVTDPLTLPAGDYDLAIRPADADPSSDPAIAGSTTLPAGANASIVAHLSASGDPMLSVFVNDVSTIATGETRITVRHTAAAPEVDVRANESVVFSSLANPDEAKADIAAGTISADVVLAGTDTVALGPADLTLAEGTNTIVYAVGSAEAGNLSLLTQSISGLHSAPTGVPAGEAGLADTGNAWVALAMAVGALALLGAAVPAVARRRR